MNALRPGSDADVRAGVKTDSWIEHKMSLLGREGLMSKMLYRRSSVGMNAHTTGHGGGLAVEHVMNASIIYQTFSGNAGAAISKSALDADSTASRRRKRRDCRHGECKKSGLASPAS